MNIWADLGIRWFAVWLFWLRGGGERYRGVSEFEGAALVGGGFGEHGHVCAGAVVADLVAGEGGQVVEQAAGVPPAFRTAAQIGCIWKGSEEIGWEMTRNT